MSISHEEVTAPSPSTGLRSVTPLPSPVTRFYSLAAATQPAAMETVVIDTVAWMRRPGVPRIPLEIRMAHRLGIAFVHDIRVGRGRLSIPFGLDAYVDGHGIMRVGRSVHAGSTFDQGALIAMWGEALVFPGSWSDRADVRWVADGEDSAWLIVPGGDGDIPIRVAFDPETGLPAACLADRFKGEGPLTGWSGTWSDWRIAEDGVLAPRGMRVRWMDEPEPWLDIRVVGLAVGPSIDDAIDRARATFAASVGQQRSAEGSRPTG